MGTENNTVKSEQAGNDINNRFEGVRQNRGGPSYPSRQKLHGEQKNPDNNRGKNGLAAKLMLAAQCWERVGHGFCSVNKKAPYDEGLFVCGSRTAAIKRLFGCGPYLASVDTRQTARLS